MVCPNRSINCSQYIWWCCFSATSLLFEWYYHVNCYVLWLKEMPKQEKVSRCKWNSMPNNLWVLRNLFRTPLYLGKQLTCSHELCTYSFCFWCRLPNAYDNVLTLYSDSVPLGKKDDCKIGLYTRKLRPQNEWWYRIILFIRSSHLLSNRLLDV